MRNSDMKGSGRTIGRSPYRSNMTEPKPSFAGKALALIAERRLPWRMSRWLERRRLERARERYDRRVRDTHPVITGQESPQFEVHVLLGHKHVGMTLWCVKSLLHFAGKRYHVVLHDDGSLSEDDLSLLAEHLVNVRIFRRLQADALVRPHLAGMSNAMRYRFSPKETSDHRGVKYDMHVFALRLFDFNLLTNAKRILVLDCDVLFFAPPIQLMAWAEEGTPAGSVYSVEQYVPLRNARYEIVGYRKKDPLPVDANAGLLGFDKSAYDLAAIESWIGKNLDRMDRLATFEQHAYNHLLKRSGSHTPLPDAYSFNYTDGSVVASHFAIKHLFFENIARVEPALLAGR